MPWLASLLLLLVPAISLFAGTPKRLISLSPNATTILCDLGAQENLVGITRYCTPPPSQKTPKIVGGFLDPSIETILRLKPDLVIRSYAQEKSFIDRLQRYGIKTLILHEESYGNIKKDISLIGNTIGKDKEAAKILQNWKLTEENIQKKRLKTTQLPTPRVLIRWGEVFAGTNSYFHEAILLCGGKNCVPASPRAWPQLGKEALLKTQPDILICILPKGPKNLTHAPQLAKELSRDPIYAHFPAVKSAKVWIISEHSRLHPSSQFYTFLPELFEAITPKQN